MENTINKFIDSLKSEAQMLVTKTGSVSEVAKDMASRYGTDLVRLTFALIAAEKGNKSAALGLISNTSL